jgi:parvulin-like peptidyl-prolyl isomerase
MAKNNLVRDIDDLTFESNIEKNELDELEDISEEELAEIEELVEKPKKKSKKTPKKKSKKKSKKKKKKNSSQSIFYAVLILVIVALIVATGFMTNWFTPNNEPNTSEEGVAAYVNGVPITTDYLNQRYDVSIKASLAPIEKESLLNTLVNQELMQQKAEEIGIVVTVEESEFALNQLLVVRGMTKEQLEESLVKSGMTIEDLLSDFQYYLLIDKVANATFMQDLKVSNSDLVNYLSERVLVRHILLLSEEENDELYNQLDELKQELVENDEVFCDYVTEYSEDPASVDICGRYFFTKGEMVAEFEEAAFNLGIDEITIIKTQYGYHLIQRIAFDDAIRQQAEAVLLDTQATIELEKFIQELRDNADIKMVYSEDASEDNAGFDVIDEEPIEELEDMIDEESEVVVEDDSETIVEEEPVVVVESEEEVLDEEESPIVEEILIDDEPVDVSVEEEVIDDNESEVIVEEEPVTVVEEIPEEEVIVEEESEVIIEKEPVVVVEDEPELIMFNPIIKFFYSESDENKAEITQLIRDLQLQDYIDVEWRCVRVNTEDREICIELYGEPAYEVAMTEASDLGLMYAPTIFIDNIEYVGAYSVESVTEAICNMAGC